MAADAKTIRFIMLVLGLGLLLQGCTERADYCFYGAFCPTDISHVRIGATRADIESKLEEPVAKHLVGDEQAVTYEYFVERQRCAQVTIFGVSCWDEWKKNRLVVIYDTDQKVVSYGDDVRKYIRQKVCEMGYSQAKQLTTEEQARRYQSCTDSSAYPMWTCIAANTGQSPHAAYQFSKFHSSGAHFVEKDLSKALLWLLLSASYFEAEDQTTTQAKYWSARYQQETTALKKRMTSDQIAEADHLLTEWKPDSAECEVISEQGEN